MTLAIEKSVDELEELKQSFLKGRDDLSGSEQSWRILLTQDEVQLAVAKLARDINERFAGQSLVIVCVLKGCVYFFVDLTRRLTIPHSTYFLEASSYHDGTTQDGGVELLSIIVPDKFFGKQVLLVDELFDHGLTLHAVKQALVSTKGTGLREEDVTTCTVFQKKKDKVPLNRDGVPYAPPDLVAIPYVPDVWMVGYGLDDAQHKRGWPHVFAVPKPEGMERNAYEDMFQQDKHGRMTTDARRTYRGVRNDLMWVLNSE